MNIQILAGLNLVRLYLTDLNRKGNIHSGFIIAGKGKRDAQYKYFSKLQRQEEKGQAENNAFSNKTSGHRESQMQYLWSKGHYNSDDFISSRHRSGKLGENKPAKEKLRSFKEDSFQVNFCSQIHCLWGFPIPPGYSPTPAEPPPA